MLQARSVESEVEILAMVKPDAVDVRVGTSGYSYSDWLDVFYPEGVSSANYLTYYSSCFSTVELNFSYYRMPTSKQLSGMLARSGPGMDFSIKAHESFTHRIEPSTWMDSIREYRNSLAPLLEDGRLASVLCQFPYSFHYASDNRRYLHRLLTELTELPLVVEFRNAEWLSRRVFDTLRELQVGFCCVDEPRLRGLPPSLDVVTSDLAYVRFHGRNAQKWWTAPSAAERFDYLYTPEELNGWIARITSMLRSAGRMRIYFNNHRRGQAPANAGMFKKLLFEAGVIESGP